MSKLLEPPEGRKVFTLRFEPTPADIDENGHVNNVVYLRWAQDLGVAHWQRLAPAEAQATWAWVALRHEIDYRRALLPGETCHGRTWVSGRDRKAPASPASSASMRRMGPCAPR